jgi:GNAT superfamily N-acetyltransferase
VASTAPTLRIEPLSERHDREVFTSGVEPLDRYLRLQAGQDARRRVASCFVLVSDGERVPIGYYTLAATSIALGELPEALAKRLPRYPVIPATLMGRLAVDARHQGRGHGEFMLLDAFSRVLRNDIASYAFVVDAKDEKVARFYQRYRFGFLVEGGRRLFIPMAEVAKFVFVRIPGIGSADIFSVRPERSRRRVSAPSGSSFEAVAFGNGRLRMRTAEDAQSPRIPPWD